MTDVPDAVSAAFASDNAAPHIRRRSAIAAANDGPVPPSYGADPVTRRATERLRAVVRPPQAEVLFAFTGTAANIIALSAAVRPWQEILCSDIAHSLLDEAGGPVRLSGATLTALPSDDGFIDPARLDRAVLRRGEVHHSQPRIVSITQPPRTAGWRPAAIAEFVDHAHELDLLVHVDGARLANAVAALGVTPAEAIGEADIVTVGGTRTACCSAMPCWSAAPSTSPASNSPRSRSATWPASTAMSRRSSRRCCPVARGWNSPGTRTRWRAGSAPGSVPWACDWLPHRGQRGVRRPEPGNAEGGAGTLRGARPRPLRPTTRFVCSWATTDDDVDAALAIVQAGCV